MQFWLDHDVPPPALVSQSLITSQKPLVILSSCVPFPIGPYFLLWPEQKMTSVEERIARVGANDLSLTTLALEFNNIGAVGATALATALTTNTTLTTLDFSYNKIGGVATTQLDRLLARNTHLFNTRDWSFRGHVTFGQTPATGKKDCHQLVMTALLCNTACPVFLPEEMWAYIFSFWQQRHFK